MLTVEIIDGTMIAMDEDGQVLEYYEVKSRRGGCRDAKDVVHAWGRIHAIDVASAYIAIENHFSKVFG